MKTQISFKILNPEFDQDYANQYQEGKESDGNRKYDSAVTHEIENVASVELIDNGIYNLKVKYKTGEIKQIPIMNVSIFKLVLVDGKTVEFGVSKSILQKTHQAQNSKYKVIRCYFYVNSEPASVELGNNLLINVDEIPEELKSKS